jgi:hypothetical protein
MKMINLLGAMAVAGLVAFTGNYANAQGDDIVQKISIKLTARMETNWSVGDLYKYKIIKVKVNTKLILQLLEEATTNAPGTFDGASLVLVNYGDAVQVRNGTNVLADVSRYFDEDWSDDVSSGTYDDATGKDVYRGYWIQWLTFDDERGHRFDLTGMVTETFKASAADDQDVRKVSDSMTLNGAGPGEAEGEFLVISGKIVTKGKGTDIW